MKVPFLSRRAHMREVAKLGESYRWQVKAAEGRASRAEEQLRQAIGAGLDVHKPYPRHDRDTRVFTVEMTEHLVDFVLGHDSPAELARRVGERVSIELLGMHNDHRPDIRESDRIMGLHSLR